MGLQSRKKSGRVFDGSKLNVEGQGIYNVNRGGVRILLKEKKESLGKPLSQLVPTTTTTTTINQNEKQFQDYEYFEFMDNYSYEFQN